MEPRLNSLGLNLSVQCRCLRAGQIRKCFRLFDISMGVKSCNVLNFAYLFTPQAAFVTTVTVNRYLLLATFRFKPIRPVRHAQTERRSAIRICLLELDNKIDFRWSNLTTTAQTPSLIHAKSYTTYLCKIPRFHDYLLFVKGYRPHVNVDSRLFTF